MNGSLSTDHLRVIDPLNAEWVTALLLAILVMLALTNAASPRKWALLTQSMLRMRLAKQILREEIDLQDRLFTGLLVVAVAVLALFGWQGFMQFSGEAPNYLQCLAVVVLALVGHLVLVGALRTLFQGDGGLAEYRASGLLLIIMNGLLLLPITMLIAYRSEWRSELLLFGAGLIGLFLLFRWVRGAWIAWSEGLSPGYIIIYLCAAEAVPLLLMINALVLPVIVANHP
jgi:hypothetical protein